MNHFLYMDIKANIFNTICIHCPTVLTVTLKTSPTSLSRATKCNFYSKAANGVKMAHPWTFVIFSSRFSKSRSWYDLETWNNTQWPFLMIFVQKLHFQSCLILTIMIQKKISYTMRIVEFKIFRLRARLRPIGPKLKVHFLDKNCQKRP